MSGPLEQAVMSRKRPTGSTMYKSRAKAKRSSSRSSLQCYIDRYAGAIYAVTRCEVRSVFRGFEGTHLNSQSITTSLKVARASCLLPFCLVGLFA